MRTLLLPVKDFSGAKHRLSPVLTQTERAGLARAMCQDVVAAVAGAKNLERVVVFTASEEVAGIARLSGFDIVQEEAVRGHSHAVNQMTELLTASGTVVAIASDLPALQSGELDTVMKACESTLVLLPSRDGTGTNGVVMHLGMRIEMSYGEDSLRRHLAAAAAAGIPCTVMAVPGIALDIDTWEDLLVYVQTAPSPSHTRRYIEDSRIIGKLHR